MAQAAAIFDLDDTLLSDASGKLILKYLFNQGQLWRYFRRRDIFTLSVIIMRYRMGLIDTTQAMQRAVQSTAGIDVEELWRLIRRWFDEIVIDVIAPGGRERLDWHLEQGHIPVICSASSQFSVKPVAEHLGIPNIIYTEWLAENGRLTGKVRLPIAYGHGKVHWVNQWAATNQVDLHHSYFYTDHISDRPLLEKVGHPVAVNPDRKLIRLAHARQWSILHWH